MATWIHRSLFAVAFFSSFCFVAARAEDDPQAEYLSALLSDRMVSMTQGWGELGVDTAVKPIGAPAAKLRIKDKEYAHGLGHHANGEIVFDLAGSSRRFRPTSASNGWTGTDPGSVIFQVFVDGKKVFDSGVMRENDPPRPVTVSVEGAERVATGGQRRWRWHRRGLRRLGRRPADSRSGGNRSRCAVGRRRSLRPRALLGSESHGRNEGQPIDEMPAEDIAPYTEILPSADGSYAVPAKNGSGQHRSAMG